MYASNIINRSDIVIKLVNLFALRTPCLRALHPGQTDLV